MILSPLVSTWCRSNILKSPPLKRTISHAYPLNLSTIDDYRIQIFFLPSAGVIIYLRLFHLSPCPEPDATVHANSQHRTRLIRNELHFNSSLHTSSSLPGAHALWNYLTNNSSRRKRCYNSSANQFKCGFYFPFSSQ